MPDQEPEIRLEDSTSGIRYRMERLTAVSVLNKPAKEAVPSLVDGDEPLWAFLERILLFILDDKLVDGKLGLLRYPARWAVHLILDKLHDIVEG